MKFPYTLRECVYICMNNSRSAGGKSFNFKLESLEPSWNL